MSKNTQDEKRKRPRVNITLDPLIRAAAEKKLAAGPLGRGGLSPYIEALIEQDLNLAHGSRPRGTPLNEQAARAVEKATRGHRR